MSKFSMRWIGVATVLAGASLALGQATTGPSRGPGGRPPVVIGPDDKPSMPEPPAGFDVARPDAPRGQVTLVEYYSSTVGTRRKANVYTPPGYDPTQKYPVLFLLHGIGGDVTEWMNAGAAIPVLDNLYASGQIAPMIVVFPNGRAQPDDRPVGDVFRHAPAFETFTDDLLKDLLPFVESKYPLLPGRENRAIAGLSMGGGQSLNIGLAHPETFAWVGGFSSAPNTKQTASVVSKPSELNLKLLYLSCGDRDGLLNITQRVHAFLKAENVPHVYHVGPGGHDGQYWRRDLYHFAQRLFRDAPTTMPAAKN